MRAALASVTVAPAVSSATPAGAPVPLFPLAVERTYPSELAAAVMRGAVVVDIRSNDQRGAQGTLPGALAIAPDLVATRLDPANPGRLAAAVDHDVEWVLVSADGAESHRVVAALQKRGLRRVTHLAGGFDAIKAANLSGSVAAARHVAADVARVTAH
ncbi:MAG: rhodanese-like domain-containing protein [Rhodococcus sp.]|uniref:rhodanese-like domain-containing protein n=1 Tax=Rhodococcus TaxID=1827 RepID=UPI00168F6EF7|nr:MULTISPECIES: rhodanese-like domain-containing protein [Rhodococcus]NLV80048.1 rhodanese-like domain-containing protein [Rhodococcus sp. (in: high G+C Gram-positive bacteria)]